MANELAKITDTLQTQAEKLRNEKKYLADSIADLNFFPQPFNIYGKCIIIDKIAPHIPEFGKKFPPFNNISHFCARKGF